MNVFIKHRRFMWLTKSFVCGFLIFILTLVDGRNLFERPFYKAEAAEATIDVLVNTSGPSHTRSGARSVFISDQVGYSFYRDSGGQCAYSKTTDGGTNWGTAVQIDSQTDCVAVSVWYDGWTSGATTSYIQIATMDSGDDDIWYNRLDTETDTRLLGASPVSVTTAQGVLTIAATTNNHSITRGTDGTVYIGISDDVDSFVVECTSGCDVGGNWSETGTNPMDLAADFIQLLPLSDGKLLLINRDISADDMRSQEWSGSSWTGSWATIDGTVVENATYDIGFDAVVSPETGDVFLAYIADNNDFTTADHDLRTAKYSGGSWGGGTAIFTNTTRGLTSVSIGLDRNKDEVYVAYTIRGTIGTANTARVHWATSTNAISTWSAERGPVDASADDDYGVSLNYFSDERIHVSWTEQGPDSLFGDTIADIAPITRVSATGTQVTLTRASSSNFYVGGKFSIVETVATRDVTDIAVTEHGTVNGATGIANVDLFYDLDTTSPYNCASESYAGGEAQFGNTDANGFSGADGVSNFSDIESISPTQAMCVYVVLDILNAAGDNVTLDIQVASPETDVLVSGGVTAAPESAVSIASTTSIVNSVLTQTHYHWRNDDGTQATATSKTAGVQDTVLTALQRESPARLRFGISNEGSTTSLPTTLTLEYSTTSGACTDANNWINVGTADDAWNMYDSAHLTNATNTTDIATSTGGVVNENTSFISANGGVRDTSSSLGSLTFASTSFTEAEFSLVASSTATEGATYCFRLTDGGLPLLSYTNYPQVTISADVTVSATSSQTSTTDIPTSNFYIGGKFVVTENISSRNVTNITLTENGTVDGSNELANIRLYYDLDTSLPYNCVSETYTGGETQFGATSTAFTAANGTSTFAGSVAISTTSTLCLYPVLDVLSTADNGDTIDLAINQPSAEVVVSGGGSVSPAIPVDITGSTTLNGSLLTQTHYHWRNDDGSEGGASSATVNEDTSLSDFSLNSPIRLRLQVSNEGATSSPSTPYRLDYGIKITTCDAVSVWTDVGATSDAWDMYDSLNLTNATNTTDIATSTGGVSNPSGKTFLAVNGGVRDTESSVASTTLTSTQFTELEYSITSTASISYETTYCFRVSNNGNALSAYTTYAELITTPKRDFKVQRGTATVSGTSTTLIAGVNYTAPSSSTTAFVRITSSHHTGAGNSTAGNTQNADDVTAFILNPENITTSFTIARPSTAVNNTRVSWEILEFIGDPGTDNEMIVRYQSTTTISLNDLTATSSALSNITSDNDVAVFITGIRNNNTATLYYTGAVTSSWLSASNEAVFTRTASGAVVDVSYAVVEFVGLNWNVQRVEHNYNLVGSAETENITAVNSLTRTFVHSQKRFGSVSSNQVNFGHQVWLSSMGVVSFLLPTGAATTSGQTSVAWVVENMQTSSGAMVVQRSNGIITGGVEPRTTNINIGDAIDATNNTSIFGMTSFEQTTTNYPRVLGDIAIVSTSTYQIWNSDISGGINFYYRSEVVEWPTAGLAQRQNYYQFYVDNDDVLPTDPWPPGATNLGEVTSITAFDEPLGDGDLVRIRMSVQVSNTTLPAGLQTYKLQYGLRSTTCSAIASWTDVGQTASSTIWRAYNGTPADGTALSTTTILLSVSDEGGRYEENNPSAANPTDVADGDDVEYDWLVEHNGAAESSVYCFKMVKSDDSELDGYNYYPEIRTAGFSPVTSYWRWYDDEQNATPSSPLDFENTAPIEIANGLVLRVLVDELKNVNGNNVKFKLQYSEYSDFSNVIDVVATSTCTATSTWCYTDGGGTNNAYISTTTLLVVDSCIGGVGDGCGTHNESADFVTGLTHGNGARAEYSFPIIPAAPRAGAVYYFRLYDVTRDLAVISTTTYPSLVTESAILVYSSLGLPIGTTTEGIVTDISTTATGIDFGTLAPDTAYEAAQRFTIDTNATEGYQVLVYTSSNLVNSYGEPIPNVTGTNQSPNAWSTGCSISATGCLGYHTSDDILSSGSTRFSPNDTYASFSSTTPHEIFYSPVPTTESLDMIYKLQVGDLQAAGNYETNIVYLAIPVF